jgi:cold shock CspA family protein
MATGKITSYNKQSHFGWIKPDDGTSDIPFTFIHTAPNYSGFDVNDSVTYELIESNKGWIPSNVQKS